MNKTAFSRAKMNLLRLILFPYKSIIAFAFLWYSLYLMDNMGERVSWNTPLVIFVNCVALVIMATHFNIYTLKRDLVYRSAGIFLDKSTWSIIQSRYISKFSLNFKTLVSVKRLSRFNLFEYGKIALETDNSVTVVDHPALFVEQIKLAMWIISWGSSKDSRFG